VPEKNDILPKMIYYRIAHWISAITWTITRIPIPKPLRSSVLGKISKILKINLREAEKPVSQYKSINHLFTRALKQELRPQGNAWMISPVDGRFVSQDLIHEGQLLQVKDIRYPLEKLIPDNAHKPFRFGCAMTIYLSPSDCHRIFSPVRGRIKQTIYVPGALFPVREPYISGLPNLYALNERVVTILETPLGDVAIVMVAAINVSTIELQYQKDRINNKTITVAKSNTQVEKGDWIATFHLGSTVVILTESRDIKIAAKENQALRYCENLAYV
jgi:phosphatidylserine decarboxylase